MTEFGEPFPEHPEQNYSTSGEIRRLGSRRPDLEQVLASNQNDLLDTLHNSDVKNFHSDYRMKVYNHIQESLHGNSSEMHKAILYVTTESIKWVSEELYNEYPYGSDEALADSEIAERLNLGLEVVRLAVDNLPLDPHAVSDTLKLALELEDALGRKDYKETSYTGKSAGPTFLYLDELRGSDELVRVATMCLDFTKNHFDQDTQKAILGEDSLDLHYIRQFESLPARLKEEWMSKLFYRAADSIEAHSESALDNIFWMFKQAEVSQKDSVQRKMLSTAVSITKELQGEAVLTSKDSEYNNGVELSLFEKRLHILNSKLKDDFIVNLVDYPDFLKAVVEMNESEDQRELWSDFSERVIVLCSSAGVDSLDGLNHLSYIQAAFKDVAPQYVFKKVEKVINERYLEGI